MRIFETIRQLVWTAIYYGYLLLFASGIWVLNLVSLLIAPVLPKAKYRPFLRWLVYRLARIFVRPMLMTGNIKTNRDRLVGLAERPGGALIVANHPSMFDAPLILSRIPGIVCVFKSALKQGLLLPLTARMVGYLSNDEGMDMLRDMLNRLEKGDKILVFPEGTRTNEGFLNPLNKGYALAAIRAKVPVVLIAIRADSPILSKKQHFLKSARFPVSFNFEVGPTIEPGEFDSVNQLNSFVENWLRTTLSSTSTETKQFLPVSAKTENLDGSAQATFTVPDNPFYCHGHMPGNPLAPAYAQLAWARETALTGGMNPRDQLHYRRVKFLKPIRPGDTVVVRIDLSDTGGRLSLSCLGEPVTRGSFTVDTVPDAKTGQFRPVILIPSYNTGSELLVSTVRAARTSGYPVLVMIDGSTDGSDAALKAASADDPQVEILGNKENFGKGEAVHQAAEHALKNGYTHALLMDADGQHPHSVIPEMMQMAKDNPDSIVMGQPQFGEEAPFARVYGRHLTSFWTNIETLWCGLGDTLFGMRVYPVRPLLKAFSQTSFARGFDFEPEIAVRMAWMGCSPKGLPVPVRYLSKEEGGVSHFRYIRDNLKLTWLHFRLVPEFLLFRIIPFLIRKQKWQKAS